MYRHRTGESYCEAGLALGLGSSLRGQAVYGIEQVSHTVKQARGREDHH